MSERLSQVSREIGRAEERIRENRRYLAQLEDQADRMGEVRRQQRRIVDQVGVCWKGPEAIRFQQQSFGRHEDEAKRLAHALEEAHGMARQQGRALGNDKDRLEHEYYRLRRES